MSCLKCLKYKAMREKNLLCISLRGISDALVFFSLLLDPHPPHKHTAISSVHVCPEETTLLATLRWRRAFWIADLKILAQGVTRDAS